MNHSILSSGISIPCVHIQTNPENKTSTRNLNWRVFPILITLCKVCSIFSFYGFLRFFNSLPNWLWALQWWVTRLSVTGYSWRGGRREGNFQNRRKNNSWLGYVTPKSKTNIGSDQTWPFDGQSEQSKGSGFELFEPVCTSTFCCKWTNIFSIKQDPLSFRKTFHDMWIVW